MLGLVVLVVVLCAILAMGDAILSDQRRPR